MLRDEIIKYTELTGEDGNHTPIMKIGAYLDGYKKGSSVLDKIREEIIDGLYSQEEIYGREEMIKIDTEMAEAFNSGLNYCIDIIDEYRQERFEKESNIKTNGDRILTMFPDAKVTNMDSFIRLWFDDTYYSEYNKEWWNAPYQKEVSE